MGAKQNKELVERYFTAMQSGDPTLPELLCDDVSWWAPPSSPLGGLHEGKAAVLELMSGGIDLYDANTPMQVEISQLVADDEWVAVQMTMDAKTAKGEDYRNHYHFAFRIRGGRICEVKEHFDTQYALEKLFS
jgi:ketosteroid isomerase-like protein